MTIRTPLIALLALWGLPGAVAAAEHTGRYAVSSPNTVLTVEFNDPGGWPTYQVLRFGKPVTISVRETRHGPVLSDVLSDRRIPAGLRENGQVLSLSATLLQPDDPHIVAIASDIALPQAKVPVIDLNDIERIVDLLLQHATPLKSAAAALRSA